MPPYVPGIFLLSKHGLYHLIQCSSCHLAFLMFFHARIIACAVGRVAKKDVLNLASLASQLEKLPILSCSLFVPWTPFPLCSLL